MNDLRLALSEALTRPDDELLASIAADLFGDELGVLPSRGGRDRARRWLDRFVEDRRDELCGTPAVQHLLDDEKYDELEDTLVIAAALAEIAGLQGTSLVAAAALIARRGIRALCARK